MKQTYVKYLMVAAFTGGFLFTSRPVARHGRLRLTIKWQKWKVV